MSFDPILSMFCSLILTVTLFLVSRGIEATRYTNTEADLIALGEYNFEAWRKHNSMVFTGQWKDNVSPNAVVKKLEKLDLFQLTPFFQIAMRVLPRGKPSTRIKKYFEASYSFYKKTSLIHKDRTLADNLIDILTKHNGCSGKEISKISKITDIFEPYSLIQMSIEMVDRKEKTYCYSAYETSLKGVDRLVGQRNVEIIFNLMSRIDPISLRDFSQNLHHAKPDSIETLSYGIALYLANLNHPDLDMINAENVAESESPLEEIYSLEVKKPASQLCRLTSGIDGYFPIRKYEDLSPIFAIDRLVAFEERTKFCCDIESLEYASIKSRLQQHFLVLKNVIGFQESPRLFGV